MIDKNEPDVLASKSKIVNFLLKVCEFFSINSKWMLRKAIFWHFRTFHLRILTLFFYRGANNFKMSWCFVLQKHLTRQKMNKIEVVSFKSCKGNNKNWIHFKSYWNINYVKFNDDQTIYQFKVDFFGLSNQDINEIKQRVLKPLALFLNQIDTQGIEKTNIKNDRNFAFSK